MSNQSDASSAAAIHSPRLFVTLLLSAAIAVLGVAVALFQATLFDYRFGLTALALIACALIAGRAAGAKKGFAPKPRNGAIWIAGSGIAAAILTMIMIEMPFGPVATYLLLAVSTAAPFFLAASGLGQFIETTEPASALWHGWAALLGAAIGAALVAELLSMIGPLALAWGSAIVLCLSALGISRQLKAIVLSAAGAIALSFLGHVVAWDFSVPPAWIQDDKNPAKEFYVSAATQGQHARIATYWNTFSRTDVAAADADNKNWNSVSTNGMQVGRAPVAQVGAESSEQRGIELPLITLPLAAGQPQSVMAINSGAGLLSRLAARAGVAQIRDLESNVAMRRVMDGSPGALAGQPGITFEYGAVRNRLRQDKSSYDQVYLTLPQKQASGWTEPEPVDNFLYTKEAFKTYWSHLKSGGMLVVLSGNEILYMRAILTAWEVLEEDKIEGGADLIRQAWGFRTATPGVATDLYQYMFMIVKGRPADELTARVHSLADHGTVNLFGPGMTPPGGSFNVYEQPYYILYHPLGLKLARRALGDYAGRSLGIAADMDVATDMHPFFFEVAHDLHPFLKWLLAVCFSLLTYAFLIPMSPERRIDSAAAAAGPTLPVHLGYFLSLGAATAISPIALFHQGALWIGDSGGALAAVLLGMGLGVVIGGTMARRRQHAFDRNWMGFSAVAIVLSVLMSWLIAVLDIGGWPEMVQALVVGGLALPAGIFAAVFLPSGLQFIARNLPGLVVWSWTTFGLAIVAGGIATLWLAQFQGFQYVWLAGAGCYGGMLGIGWWLNASESRRIKRDAIASQPAPAKKESVVPVERE